MKVGRYCIICGKTNKENVETLFSFPKDPSRKKQWKDILRITGDIKFTARVCQNHFKRDQLVRDKLKKNAVPTLKVKEETADLPTVATKLVPLKPKPIPFGLPVVSQPIILGPLFQPDLCFQTRTAPQFVGDSTLNITSNEKATCHSRSMCKQQNYVLKKKLKRLAEEKKKMVNLDQVFSSNPCFQKIIQSQILRYQNKLIPYSHFEKSAAISIYYTCGRQGYRTLISLGLKLPTVDCISKWMRTFRFDSGINACLLQSLSKFVEEMDDKQRDCVIVWDEMSIKEYVEYNQHLDRIEGIVDLGHLGRSLERATEVLVFMVQGIKSKWKFPVSFYFTNQSTTAEPLSSLVQENIKELLRIGFRIRMGICDMAFKNRSVYKKLGVAENKPYSFVDGRKIYFVHDTPHLIKLIRNNLMKHNFEIITKSGNRTISQKVKWLHILQFYGKDKRLTTRMAPRLTNGHVFLKDYSKMKVKLAVQLFSHTVYAGMMTMVALKIFKNDIKITANFVKTVNDMFDILNMSKYNQDRPGRCAQNLFQNFGKFDDYINFIKSVNVCKSTKRADFLRGLELTLRGVKDLCIDLRQEGYDCVYTRQLQQDCLENYFSAVRMKGGFNRNPTATQFQNNFKYLFFARFIKNSTHGNTEGPRSFLNYLQNVQLGLIKNNSELHSSQNKLLPDKDKTNFYNLKSTRRLKLGSEQMTASVNYFGAAAVFTINKKTKCSNCDKMLTQGCNNENHDNRYFVDFKMFSDRHGFRYLNEETESLFLTLNNHFDVYLKETLRTDGRSISDGIMEKYLLIPKVNEWINGSCQLHKLTMIRYFVKAKLFRISKDKNDLVRQSKSWDQTRRDLRNQ